MKKLAVIFSIGTFFSLLAPASSQAAGRHIILSSYYLAPGQNLTVTGHRFNPNESVNITVAGLSQNVSADSSGNFSSQAFTIPNSAVNSKILVTARGNGGNYSSARLTVSGFYPLVTPSGWYIVPGNHVSFIGRRFAPNEQVKVSYGGKIIDTISTDSSGVFTTKQYNVPYSSGKLTYGFAGQNSHAATGVVVRVDGQPAYLVLSNYYAPAGSSLQVSGFGFGDSENVNLTFGGVGWGTATANEEGKFIFNGTVPGGSGGVKVIAVTGSKTGKTSRATFTKAP